MVKYQRFVAYVYEYRKGKKEENCGFLRVETRNDNVTVEMHIKCPGLPADEKCSIYGFTRKAGLLEGVLLGSVWSESEKLDCMIESDKLENCLWKEKFLEFGGMIIQSENGAFFGTEWDDQPIKPENFEPSNNLREKIQTERNMYSEEGSQEDLIEKKQEVETTQAAEQPENSSEFCPFHDGEITECRKIQPNDFFKSCPRNCAFRNNRFLEHGYYNFGHLLLGKRTDGQRILGVPGGYDQQERFMANMFGFPYFKESQEIQIPGGRGGYWYRLINPSNPNQSNRVF